TEVSSINKRVFRTLSSPMIIAPKDWITIEPEGAADFILTVDSDSYHKLKIKEIKFKISKKKIHFAKYRHTHYWHRVKTEIIDNKDWITIEPEGAAYFILTVDSDSYHKLKIKEIKFKISKKKIHFAKYRHTHFWHRVQTAFIGDEDAD